ncbi:MAG: hypothetical protein ABL932_16585, partial [Terricaulis sp.]
AITNGQSLTAVASANHARVVATSRTVDRRAARDNLPQGMAEQLFAVAEGAPVHLVGDAGILIGLVEHINRPDLTAIDPQILEATRTYAERPCLQQALQAGAPPVCGVSTSVVEALQGQIVADANPRRNDRVIDSVYRPSTAPEADAAQQ